MLTALICSSITSFILLITTLALSATRMNAAKEYKDLKDVCDTLSKTLEDTQYRLNTVEEERDRLRMKWSN